MLPYDRQELALFSNVLVSNTRLITNVNLKEKKKKKLLAHKSFAILCRTSHSRQPSDFLLFISALRMADFALQYITAKKQFYNTCNATKQLYWYELVRVCVNVIWWYL